MKKLLMALAIIAMVFTGCEEEKEPDTKLTVRNESGTKISHAKWNNTKINWKYNDNGLGTGGLDNIEIGENRSGKVQPGTGYIYFRKSTYPTIINQDANVRTSETVTVEAGEEVIFTFTDNTVIVYLDNNTTGTLGE